MKGPDFVEKKREEMIRDKSGKKEENRPVGECKSGRPLETQIWRLGSNMNSERAENMAGENKSGKSFGAGKKTMERR